MLELDLMDSANGSACIIERSADVASHCRIPLELEKYSDKDQLVITTLHYSNPRNEAFTKIEFP